MHNLIASAVFSEPAVAEHFDRAPQLYIDHSLGCYRESVGQRLDLLMHCTYFQESDPLRLLDVGCGGGAFLDMFLERFPQAQATGIDISRNMLSGNVASERKKLKIGDALSLQSADLGSFDAVAVDTVMHHLISREGYSQTRDRIRGFLLSLHQLLQPGGVVVVREIYHEYHFLAEFGSRAIFELTRLQVPEAIRQTLRHAGLETANVGVCFLTRSQWQSLFIEAGFSVAAMEDRCWPGQPYRRFGFKRSGDLHFVLRRSRPQL